MNSGVEDGDHNEEEGEMGGCVARTADPGGNDGHSPDDAGLAAVFTEADFKVNSARVVRRRWGHPRRSKGYGFVDVGDEEEQKKAMEALQGKELEGGRAIAVKIAVNPAHEEGDEAAAPEDEKAPETPKEETVAA